jgi:hypothetical protein
MSFYPLGYITVLTILIRSLRLFVGYFCFMSCSMVNKYKRKTDRQSWREEDIQNAIDAVQRDEMEWLLASKEFNVPQATLRRRARNKNKHVNATKKGLGRFRPSLDAEMETDLVRHLLDMEHGCLE